MHIGLVLGRFILEHVVCSPATHLALVQPSLLGSILSAFIPPYLV